MSESLTRLAPSTLSGDCYRVLKDAILNLDLPPGTVLVEQQLAVQLGISKTPVREALARLEGEGLVVAGPSGRQTRVSGLSLTRIREIYQVRLLVEPALLREMGGSFTQAELDELDRIISDAKDSIALEGVGWLVDSNDAFHLYLIRRSGNQTLISYMVGIFQQIQRVRAALRRTAFEDPQHHISHEGLESHRSILRALANHDAELAAETMKADIQRFLDLLESRMLQPALASLSSEPPFDK